MRTSQPPADLSSLLNYCPSTGNFYWKVKRNCHGGAVNPGDVAGGVKDGYIKIGVNGVIYRAHRLAWYVMTGDWLSASQDLDHINGLRSDNRWKNLRLATRSQNCMNSGLRSDNKSGCRGVSFCSRRRLWTTRIIKSGQFYFLGDFANLEDAIAARKAAEARHFGDFNRKEAA